MEMLATKPFSCPAVNLEVVAHLPGCEAFQFDAIGGICNASAVFSILETKSWGLNDLREQLAALDVAILAGLFLPGQAFRAIDLRFQRKVRLVMDTGYFCTIGEHVWRAARPDLCLLSGQGRYMGTALPMAIGAALHDSFVPTVAVMGDGGIGPFVGEIRLAVERRLPLLVVLMSDGRFASIATRAIHEHLTLKPLTPQDPSWLRIMEGFGLPVCRVETEAAFKDALERWHPTEGPAYIEIAFNADAYERMVVGIR
jgi:thiamine pyrophosphate-dependent acetolactate synthase large subunit-like protein